MVFEKQSGFVIILEKTKEEAHNNDGHLANYRQY